VLAPTSIVAAKTQATPLAIQIHCLMLIRLLSLSISCKAVYTGSIPVGAFGSGKRYLACQSRLSGLFEPRPRPAESG
jgi:hypothetical protein